MSSKTRFYLAVSAARLVLLGLGALAFSGCTAHFHQSVPATNIVMVDRAGWPVDPTGNVNCKKGEALCNGDHNKVRRYRRLDGEKYGAYLKDMFEALDRQPPGENGKRKILLYVHGGLNTQYSTIERAYCGAPTVEENGYFPIYLNWQSNLVTSYFNTLYSVRKGHHFSDAHPASWGLTPFYLAQDVARAVTRAVPVWGYMVYSDAQGLGKAKKAEKKEEKKDAVQQYQEVEESIAPSAKKLDIQVSDTNDPGAGLWSATTYVVTFPFKLVTSAILDSAGTPAWSGMKRAAEAAFRSDEMQCDERKPTRKCFQTEKFRKILATEASHASEPELKGKPTNGGFDLFLTELKHYISRNGGYENFEIVLVAHSAGAIVVNQVIRQAEDATDGKEVLPIKAIVYMAAATSVKDYEDTVLPYLRRHSETDVYHLVLNQQSERRDQVRKFLDLPPRGSLLVWIDNFLNDRRTYRDRTVGRIDSLTQSLGDLDAWQDIVDRIHIREFDTGSEASKTQPQRHGDFSALSYWRPDCWKPSPAAPSLCYRQLSAQLSDRACSKNWPQVP